MESGRCLLVSTGPAAHRAVESLHVVGHEMTWFMAPGAEIDSFLPNGYFLEETPATMQASEELAAQLQENIVSNMAYPTRPERVVLFVDANDAFSVGTMMVVLQSAAHIARNRPGLCILMPQRVPMNEPARFILGKMVELWSAGAYDPLIISDPEEFLATCAELFPLPEVDREPEVEVETIKDVPAYEDGIYGENTDV